MKNWKDKVLGIFAGIGVMSLLMGFQGDYNSRFVWDNQNNEWVDKSSTNSNYQKNDVGRYQGTAITRGGGESIIWIIDTTNGKVVKRVQSTGAGSIRSVRDWSMFNQN